ncbi:hypothetical protein LTR67_007303 [Exophiala xenobiotica]
MVAETSSHPEAGSPALGTQLQTAKTLNGLSRGRQQKSSEQRAGHHTKSRAKYTQRACAAVIFLAGVAPSGTQLVPTTTSNRRLAPPKSESVLNKPYIR